MSLAGFVTDFGHVLSVFFRDPEGLRPRCALRAIPKSSCGRPPNFGTRSAITGDTALRTASTKSDVSTPEAFDVDGRAYVPLVVFIWLAIDAATKTLVLPFLLFAAVCRHSAWISARYRLIGVGTSGWAR